MLTINKYVFNLVLVSKFSFRLVKILSSPNMCSFLADSCRIAAFHTFLDGRQRPPLTTAPLPQPLVMPLFIPSSMCLLLYAIQEGKKMSGYCEENM